MKKKKLIYQGTTKNIYTTDDDEQLIIDFKDSSLPMDGKQPVQVKERSVIAQKISALLFEYLQSFHVPTHFIKSIADHEMIVKKLDMLPIQILVHNIATGSLCKRYGLKEGKVLEIPILEYYLKDKSLGFPMINASHAVSFKLVTGDELRTIDRLTTKINAVLKSFFDRRQLKLVLFRVEYGRLADRLVVGDELSPDTLCLWESMADGVFDKKKFAVDASHAEAYEQYKQRLLTN